MGQICMWRGVLVVESRVVASVLLSDVSVEITGTVVMGSCEDEEEEEELEDDSAEEVPPEEEAAAAAVPEEKMPTAAMAVLEAEA